MVLAGKIFRVSEETELKAIAAKLKDYTREEEYVEGEYQQKLLTTVKDLRLTGATLNGVFSQDRIVHIPYRGRMAPTPRTVEAPFTFSRHTDRLLLTVLEKKWRANSIANSLSEALFITVGQILEARIPPARLRAYHEDNPQGTKVIFFHDLDFPNVDKLSLYGGDVKNTRLYSEFLSHGEIWYVVVTSRRYGHIVGLTANSIVAIFNKVEPPDYLSYVTEEVFPLIEA